MCFLVLGILLMAQTPSITVTSPNGGENWTIGSTYHITWNYTNLTGNVRIQLLHSSSSTTISTIIAETPIAAGSYTWTIPSTVVAGTDYQISVVWVSMLTVYFGDTSDGNFTISGPVITPTLTLISPNGGENWAIGSTHQILWTSTNLTGNIRILLVGQSSAISSYVIAASVPVIGGVFNWTIPSTILTGTNYKVYISSLSNSTTPVNNPVYDFSDNVFTISRGSNIPIIRVLAPNGGENWTICSTRNITWTFSNLTGFVMIQLVEGNLNQVIMTIATSVPVTRGIYAWQIPTTVTPATDYKIKITSLNPGTTFAPVFDISDNFFRIGLSTIPFITVLSPNGGENWVAGSTHDITWNYANLTGVVSIMIFRGYDNTLNPVATPIILIASNVPVGDRVYHWTIPATFPTGNNYKIRIVNISPIASTILAVSDQSDNFFTISSPITIDISTNTGTSNTTIKLSSITPKIIAAAVYNIRGQKVRSLLDGDVVEGTKVLQWDGRNMENQRVAAGIYFLKVQTDNQQISKRITLLK